jgi:hypothetical protein
MSRPKTYCINEAYFTTPISQKQAYFLGLIISDGHLNYNRGVFQYACAFRDASLIDFIRTELGSSHPIKTYVIKNRTYVRYGITNKKLVRSLIEKWNLPKLNKSKNNVDIPDLPPKFLSHFLRGFFDGDGSVWFGGGTYRAGFTGGEKMMRAIQSILLSQHIPSYLSYRYSKSNKNSCQLTINGTLHVQSLGKFLYNEANFYLERKHEKFDACFAQANITKNRRYSSNGIEDKIKMLYLNGVPQAEIAKQNNLVPSSVRACVQRLRRRGIV